MKFSLLENTKFAKMMEDVPAEDALDLAIGYVNLTYDPEDIFDEDDLETWAHENDFIHSDDITDGKTPSDLFDPEELEAWATDHGWGPVAC